MPSMALGLPVDFPAFNTAGVQVLDLATSVNTPSLSDDFMTGSTQDGDGGAGGVSILDVEVHGSIDASPLDLEALAATNDKPPMLMLKGETVYKWPASRSSPFAEPSVIAFDAIDSFKVVINSTYHLCRLPPKGLGAMVTGPGPGDLDASASGLECRPTPTLNSFQPNLDGEAFLVEYNAINSRNM
ncbi:hypothetical protein PLESTF_000242000 [Pleodorina starrii]|nr:hypothetical protein PLESTF_000242000 [Pleodorina starrii]